MINYKPTICCPQISVTYPRNPAKFSIVLLVWVEKTEGVHPPFRDCNTSILAIVAVPHRGRSDRVSGFQVPLWTSIHSYKTHCICKSPLLLLSWYYRLMNRVEVVAEEGTPSLEYEWFLPYSNAVRSKYRQIIWRNLFIWLTKANSYWENAFDLFRSSTKYIRVIMVSHFAACNDFKRIELNICEIMYCFG